VQPSAFPTPAPTNKDLQSSLATAGLSVGTIAGISVGVIVLVVVVLGACWTIQQKHGELSKDEEGIMKRYLDVMARKKDKSGASADEEGKEEDDNEAETTGDLDVRQSYADSIAEIYSPRWKHQTGDSNILQSTKGPFLPYIAGTDGGVNPVINVTPASRHMSIQMTPFKKRESTRLPLNTDVSHSGLELTGTTNNDAEAGNETPVREYSFNPMNINNNNTLGGRSVTTATNLQFPADPRRGSALTQSHMGPDSVTGDNYTSLQSRRTASSAVGGTLGMNMQLAGRSGALGPAKRLSTYTDQGLAQGQFEGETERPELLQEPVPPVPPLARKSAYQKETKGPSRFILKK